MENNILDLKNLGKSYRRKDEDILALSDLNLQIQTGEIFGLLGPNGAGKTTAVKMIMGFLKPTAGHIIYNGKQLTVAHPRPDMGYLPESFKPNPNLNVHEYIRFHCQLNPNKKAIRSDKEIESLLEKVGMAPFKKRKISELSKGMGQRVGLAQAFANDPDFLILDEPTSGLDPIGRTEVIDFLIEMRHQGKTIFFCSHILSEVEKICDRIGILALGKLRYIGNVPSFLNKWQVDNLEEGFKKEVQCETR